MDKFRLNINGKEVTGMPGQTILEVARENDIFIPTLCYDERTKIYGSCGICMCEVEGNPKLCKACATVIAPGMVINTNTERVIESRKTNLELLLSNHTGDCRPPCVLACPAHTDVPRYIRFVKEGKYDEAAAVIRQKQPSCLFHVDAIQSYGKYAIYPRRIGVDLLSVSGHKIHGPKGSGFLYVREKTKIHPQILGGGQEGGMRSGTENVPAIAGLGEAAREMYDHLDENREYLYGLKQRFMEGAAAIPGVTLNGPAVRDGAPHIVSVSVDGVRSEVLLHALEEKGIYVSAGSACSSNKPSVSRTLKAIGLENRLLDSTVRFSFSIENTAEEIDYALGVMGELIPVLSRFTRH